METKFTKGPWQSIYEGSIQTKGRRNKTNSNGGWVIAECFGADKEANINLIAAAPEMFEALEKLEDFEAHQIGAENIIAIKRALKKARGES